MKTPLKRFFSAALAVMIILSVSSAAFALGGEFEGKTVILHSNDVHGAIDGYQYIAGLKKDFESKGAEVILVDAGDFSQGTSYVGDSNGADAISMMNTVGYDVAALGNHEFDYGIEQLENLISIADFHIICSNAFKENGDPITEANYTYVTGSGLRIGFFGVLAPETLTKANPTKVKGLSFSSDSEMFSLAQQQADQLSDADIVIALTHLGVDGSSFPNRSYDLFDNVTGVDFFIDGHSHTVMEEGGNGEPIQSTGTTFENIGVIVIDNASKTIEDNYLIAVDDSTPSDDSTASAAQSITDRVDKEYGEVFARSEIDLNGEKFPGNRSEETNLGDFAADAVLWAIRNEGNILTVPEENTVAIVNGGGLRDWIHAGDITRADMTKVFPFCNSLCVVYVTGDVLLEALEASTFCTPDEPLGGFPQVSGMKYEIHAYNEYDSKSETYPDSTYCGPASIQRIKITEINGKPFDRNATYAVITNDFIAAGGDTYYSLANSESSFDTGLLLDTVLVDYIDKELGGVIDSRYAVPEGRIAVYTEIPVETSDTAVIIVYAVLAAAVLCAVTAFILSKKENAA